MGPGGHPPPLQGEEGPAGIPASIFLGEGCWGDEARLAHAASCGPTGSPDSERLSPLIPSLGGGLVHPDLGLEEGRKGQPGSMVIS